MLQIRDGGYHGGRDEEFDSLVLDEDGEDKVSLQGRQNPRRTPRTAAAAG